MEFLQDALVVQIFHDEGIEVRLNEVFVVVQIQHSSVGLKSDEELNSRLLVHISVDIFLHSGYTD